MVELALLLAALFAARHHEIDLVGAAAAECAAGGAAGERLLLLGADGVLERKGLNVAAELGKGGGGEGIVGGAIIRD